VDTQPTIKQTAVKSSDVYFVETHEVGTSLNFSAQYRTGPFDRCSSIEVNQSDSAKIVNMRETGGSANNGNYLLTTYEERKCYTTLKSQLLQLSRYYPAGLRRLRCSSPPQSHSRLAPSLLLRPTEPALSSRFTSREMTLIHVRSAFRPDRHVGTEYLYRAVDKAGQTIDFS
jgi:hypothetical protein